MTANPSHLPAMLGGVGRAPFAQATLFAPIALALIAVLAACGTTQGDDPTPAPATSVVHVEMSRAVMYESVRQLADDSDVIVVGTIASQGTVGGIDVGDDVTLSTLVVDDIVKGNGIAVGESLIVRQLGSDSLITGYPLMQVGTQYLAYLTESGLPGDQAAHYFITGVIAGLYQASQGDSSSDSSTHEDFTQVQSDGDILPAILNLSDATG